MSDETLEFTLPQDILMNTKEEEWNNVLYVQNDDVVLRDRLMTDAALGGPRPIKSEHSYSLLISSPPPSPATPGGSPHTPNSGSSSGTVDSTTANTAACIDFIHNLDQKPLELLRSRDDEMEEEYYPTISMNTTSNRGEPSSSLTSSSTSTSILTKSSLVPEDNENCPEIKDEPISEPSSPCAPCQPSCDTIDDKSTITMVSPQSLHPNTRLPHTSDSEEEDEECYTPMDVENSNVVDEEKGTILHASRQGLPPTPPSSASSDSEGAASASCSPERRDSQISTHVQNLKGLLAPSRLYVTTNTTHTTRQPIHTPLISCQPKGSTGMLTLTEEEKRTLIAEGYPVPTKLPLSKQEEKSLKKIRRKIKNKISAQESRRKKKEYMDNLERRVSILSSENSSYKSKVNALEDTNRELMKEVQRLQAMLHIQRS
ncbi:cyclic AMP response element-binding protein A isoform X2 [Harpegnathos saltator]|uniref:cyclic AMP response element-binding protein A isoform X2 n=1 Tax=Harpegnathos saltator TaxID=610380 RepID=UPI00058B0632|nr:cyclic AMP response element-binding protein A isoform X2 [Harpegnathos saltator]